MRAVIVLALGLSLATRSAAAPLADEKPHDNTRAINKILAERWAKDGAAATPTVDDLTFARRVSFDIAGRPPTAKEIQQFNADPRDSRRFRLIDRLLASDDFPKHWGDVWTDWSMNRLGTDEAQREGMRAWFRAFLTEKTSIKEMAREMLSATGSARQNAAVHFVTAHRGLPMAKEEQPELGQYEMQPLTSQAMRLFLGSDVGCATCHDHAFDPNIRQEDFWKLNVFFRQAKWAVKKDKNGTDEVLSDAGEMNPRARIFFMRRNGLVLMVRGEFIDGTKIDPEAKKSRREQFAELLTKHERFPKTMVHRVWEQIFGRGFSENNYLGLFSECNPNPHPELTDRLAGDFSASGYDLRQLLRCICQSDAYQRSSYRKPLDPDGAPLFNEWIRRPLSPRQRFAALDTVLGLKQSLTEVEMSHLARRFEATIPTPNAEIDDGNVHSAPYYAPDATAYTRFILTNSVLLTKAARHPEKGLLTRAFKQKKATDLAKELYLSVYFREPPAEELKAIVNEFEAARTKEPNVDEEAFWEDFLLAMLNASEFTQQR